MPLPTEADLRTAIGLRFKLDAVLYNFLNALLNTGVGVCGGNVVKPLAGRTEPQATRN